MLKNVFVLLNLFAGAAGAALTGVAAMRAGEMWKGESGKTSRLEVLGVFGLRESKGRSCVDGKEKERSVDVEEVDETAEDVVVEERVEFWEEEVRARRRR